MRARAGPAVVGVPEILPVLGSRASPSGRDPLTIECVYAVGPPLTPTKDRYGTPTRAVVLELVVCRLLWGVMLQLLEICAPWPSVAPRVKLKVPGEFVVPLIVPEFVFRVKPGGN